MSYLSVNATVETTHREILRKVYDTKKSVEDFQYNFFFSEEEREREREREREMMMSLMLMLMMIVMTQS